MLNQYAPIGEYGVIGDLHTAVLVGMDGSIDLLCLLHFDSPSVSAALVDAERGGRFQIAPRLEGATRRQLYLPDTNVLLTPSMLRASPSCPTSCRWRTWGRRTTSCGGRRRCGARCASRPPAARHLRRADGLRLPLRQVRLSHRVRRLDQHRAADRLGSENWRRPDERIREVRGGRQEFLFSRVMCWVALDRAIRLATKRSFPAPLLRYAKAVGRRFVLITWSAALSSYGGARRLSRRRLCVGYAPNPYA